MSTPLPLHPLTGIPAVGWRRPRPGEEERLHPIWPVLGASEDDNTNAEGEEEEGAEDEDGGGEDSGQDDGAAEEGDPEGSDQLGDPGKRALASMKGKWRSERDKRRDLEQRLAQKDQGGTDVRQQAEQAATSAANARVLRAEVRAAAAGKLADPRDALKFLDLDQFEVNGDGDVDADEIADAIEDLMKNKPYLAAATAKRFQGTGDGGAARKAARSKQLTQSDLKKMSAQQIVKAQDDGRFDDLLGAG